MKVPEKPENEEARLAALNMLDIVYTPAEERYDRITRLAKLIFKVPIALVSLVTEDTQYFKSAQGLNARETSREVSFCGHAILGNDTFIVTDAREHPDFADNPLVAGEPRVCFYAGQPISVDSLNLGTLCLIDHKPREFSDLDKETLKSLAHMIENELKLTLYTKPQKAILSDVGDIERQSLLDPTTGCWNQHGLELLLEKDLARSKQDNKPVSLLLVEVGYVNPNDVRITELDLENILKEAAQRIRISIRVEDIVARSGANQFYIFLKNADKTECRLITQNILRNISVWRYDINDESIPLTAKAGTTCNEGTSVWSSTLLLETVTTALQVAKEKNSDEYFMKPELVVKD